MFDDAVSTNTAVGAAGAAGVTVVPARRGDAMASDPTLSQLEYSLEQTQGVDLSMDKMTTIPKLVSFKLFLLY